MSVLTHINPCDTDKPYVFISYSSQDSETVWQDVLEFQHRGYNVWLDELNLDKTKASWKDDALTAIQDYCCQLVVFYISASSMTSDACYNELCHTMAEDTVAFHNGEVKYIAIETERINDIAKFSDQVYHRIMSENIPKQEKQARAKTLHLFIRDFFDTNNEKVRIHPKDETNRKMDYYDEVTASFPESTRFHTCNTDEETLPAEKDPLNSTCDEDAVYLAGLNTTLSEAEIDEQFQRAECLYAEKQYAEAIPCYLPAAAKGNCVAEFMLGSCYESVNGNDPEHPHARYWYIKAASHGFTPAMVRLLYKNAKPIPQTMASTISINSTQDTSTPNNIQDDTESIKNEDISVQNSESDNATTSDQSSSVPDEEANPHTDTDHINVVQDTNSISAFPIEILDKAVKQFWNYPLKISDLSSDQKKNLQSSFHVYPKIGDEVYYSILCVTFLNTCKEGFLLSDRYLYINNASNHNLKINLLTIQSIKPVNIRQSNPDTYLIHHNDGKKQKLIVSSVYRKEIVSMLNYLINQRYYLVTPSEKLPMQDIPMAIIKYAADEYFPRYAKKIEDLSKKQTDELTQAFRIDLDSDETFYKITCTTLLNTCKEGFLLSNRYLYINHENYKQIAVDLRLVRQIETESGSSAYRIHSDDGTVIQLQLASVYRTYVIDLLNCIIEKRNALHNT